MGQWDSILPWVKIYLKFVRSFTSFETLQFQDFLKDSRYLKFRKSSKRPRKYGTLYLFAGENSWKSRIAGKKIMKIAFKKKANAFFTILGIQDFLKFLPIYCDSRFLGRQLGSTDKTWFVDRQENVKNSVRPHLHQLYQTCDQGQRGREPKTMPRFTPSRDGAVSKSILKEPIVTLFKLEGGAESWIVC